LGDITLRILRLKITRRIHPFESDFSSGQGFLGAETEGFDIARMATGLIESGRIRAF
jgi:hypothetical protein